MNGKRQLLFVPALLALCVAWSAQVVAAQDADGAAADSIDQPWNPPPEVTEEEVKAADADIPFYNMRVEMSNARAAELCASLAKTSGDAQGMPAVSYYFSRYAEDDAKLLKRFPAHENFIRNMDFKTRLLQRAVAPEYFRKACTAK